MCPVEHGEGSIAAKEHVVILSASDEGAAKDLNHCVFSSIVREHKALKYP